MASAPEPEDGDSFINNINNSFVVEEKAKSPSVFAVFGAIGNLAGNLN